MYLVLTDIMRFARSRAHFWNAYFELINEEVIERELDNFLAITLQRSTTQQ